MVKFEFSHFYPGLDQQKFWDFLVDHEWYSKSDIMLGEQTVIKPGEGHVQGLGAIRRILIEKHNIDLTEKVVGFEAPKYFAYAVQEGGKGMPVSGYVGEFILEDQADGLLFRYKGRFEPKLFGINWLFKRVFRWRMRTMIPVWLEGYNSYHKIS